MSYGVADADGQVLIDIPVNLPGPRSPHDMGETTHYTILQADGLKQNPVTSCMLPLDWQQDLKKCPELVTTTS